MNCPDHVGQAPAGTAVGFRVVINTTIWTILLGPTVGTTRSTMVGSAILSADYRLTK